MRKSSGDVFFTGDVDGDELQFACHDARMFCGEREEMVNGAVYHSRLGQLKPTTAGRLCMACETNQEP